MAGGARDVRSNERSEGLAIARLSMVLSSLSPLFILWAIRGVDFIPDIWFVPICVLVVVVPNVLLLLRFHAAKTTKDTRMLTIGACEDQRAHILIYLVATLLPLYLAELATYRDLAAMIAALALITFVFWYLRLHYMNIFFAMRRYRVYSVQPPSGSNPHTSQEPFVLISPRRHLAEGDSIEVYRLSNTVYWECRRGS